MGKEVLDYKGQQAQKRVWFFSNRTVVDLECSDYYDFMY